MKPLKIGLVGVTGRGTGYGNLFRDHPRTEVAGICDLDSENMEGAARAFGLSDARCFDDYGAFLDSGIDVVVVGTPMPFHASQSIDALSAGKHVLSEVTAATSVQECEKLFLAAKRSSGKYMLAENCCYFHYVKACEEIVKSGRLGTVFHAESEYVHEIQGLVVNPDTGQTLWRVDRAPLHYCSHSLGPLLMFLDDWIVKATGSGTRHDILEDRGPGTISMQTGLFETNKGVTIKLLRSSLAPGPYHLFYNLYGSKGFLETDRHSVHGKGMVFVEGREREEMELDISDPDAPEEATKGGHGTSEYYVVRDFIDAIDNDTPPPLDVTKAIDMSIPGIVAHEAAMKGNIWLDVPHFE